MNPPEVLIAVIGGLGVLYWLNGRNHREGVPDSGTSAVRQYIGEEAMQRGVAMFANAGWEVVSVAPMLINRGAMKLLIGFLARQRTAYVVTFRRTV